MFEDGKRVSEVELLIDDAGAVDLHTIVGQLLLLGCKKIGFTGRTWQVPEGEEREEYCTGAFNDEEIPPIGQDTRMNVEDAKRKQARKCRGD